MSDTPTILPMVPSDPAKVLEKAARVMGGQTGCGHGWVFPMPGGVKARCGGPAICPACAKDATLRLGSLTGFA